jgi:hypothetical protein
LACQHPIAYSVEAMMLRIVKAMQILYPVTYFGASSARKA